MTNFFADGTAVDLILLLMLVEALVLVVYHRRTGRGIAAGDLVGLLLAGAFLLLALRAALTGSSWTSIALWLVASLAAHLADLVRRWRK
ncbi:hypothetical protein BH11PSE3_BH11PSE3_11450 [soil metagenome]